MPGRLFCDRGESLLDLHVTKCQFSGLTRHKSTIEVALTFRSSLARLCDSIIICGYIFDGHFTDIGRADHHADAPAAIIGGCERALLDRAACDCVIGRRVGTSMANNRTNGTLGRDRAVLNGAVCDGNMRIHRAVVLLIVAGRPADQTAHSCAAGAGDGRAFQVAVIKFDLRHGVDIETYLGGD